MSSLSGKKAVVIGAGMGGLAAAKALSGHFDRVTVLERDTLSSDAAPRPGTPQARHLHALLAGGLIALNELIPGIETELEQAGAVRIATGDVRMERPGFDPYPQRDLGLSWLSVSRPLLEFVSRQIAKRQKNIEFRGDCRGGRPEEECRLETLAADLVVDASGRGRLAFSAFESMGLPKPEETEIGIDIAYSTAVFERPDDAPSNWKVVMVLPSAPGDSRGGLLSPIENNRWIVSVGGNHGDAPPGDMEGFLAFVKTRPRFMTPSRMQSPPGRLFVTCCLAVRAGTSRKCNAFRAACSRSATRSVVSTPCLGKA